ncbi:hypothetical protein GCM10011376_34040 [Nocardioides flavus (ex Wang et al. 2016)]|uniref:Secreted protein n=1 Tax=Nocardioides flavus (ex Wang et al. 2016) TaxID=2058780 RepID=A0ABQ3HRL1_9ACTN|nr:hypothetical protein [Nocardioides flavus (ex Wang et al. 2016)]GHE18794.1 hypothetical protein GCM10011376_34040 [Nocardioides flavus (ex Wang et al. 2016)]
MNRIAQSLTLTVAALAVTAAASPAVAATKPLVDLRGADLGTHAVDAAGTAHLAGSVTGKPFDGTYVATLAADDGSLPAPGSCEPAAGTLDVTSEKRFLRLDAVGEVCGEFTDATYVVTHRFVGRYVVTDATTRRLRGTDGWILLILATQGRATVEAYDS